MQMGKKIMKFITGESTDKETYSKNIRTGSYRLNENSQEKHKYVLT